jgi:hypothetical protein
MKRFETDEKNNTTCRTSEATLFWDQLGFYQLAAASSASTTAARLRRLPCASWVSRAPLICRMPGYLYTT